MAHPQIATFARLAGVNSQPARLIYGQKTLMARTMHDIRYDAVNDEFLVTNPFALAILVFRGGADGEEAPIRVIQGPKTMIGGADRLEVDPINNEILVPEGDKILVFSRTAEGDVAPIRVIQGPDTQLAYAESAVVDPIHNLIFVGTQDRRGTLGGGAAKRANQFGPAVRALELKGKSIGMFKDNVVLTELQGTSDNDLIEKLAKDDPKTAAALREILGASEGFDDDASSSR